MKAMTDRIETSYAIQQQMQESNAVTAKFACSWRGWYRSGGDCYRVNAVEGTPVTYYNMLCLYWS